MSAMSEPTLRFLPVAGPAAKQGGPRRMAYWDWCNDSPQTGHIVVCVHGLSRQGRDFDALALDLSDRCRVISVDVAGRGNSDWIEDPMAYQVGTYAADLAALMVTLRLEQPDVRIDWVGTSMGGLIGMAIAAQPDLAPRRLVLNDVGPVIQWEALQRIGGYLGLNPSFASESEASTYLASISTGFGYHTPEQWRALSRPMLRERGDRWWLHYDPAIAAPFKALLAGDEPASRLAVSNGEAALWGLYDAITAPTLLLRGAQSDLLTTGTVEQMARRGPKARCVSFDGVGHAPTLVAADQRSVVRDFLFG